MVIKKEHVYVVFVELLAAFDLIPCVKLWGALHRFGVLSNLLQILIRLNKVNYTQIRWGKKGELTDHIWVNRSA